MKLVLTIAIAAGAASLAWGFSQVADHLAAIPEPDAPPAVSVMRRETAGSAEPSAFVPVRVAPLRAVTPETRPAALPPAPALAVAPEHPAILPEELADQSPAQQAVRIPAIPVMPPDIAPHASDASPSWPGQAANRSSALPDQAAQASFYNIPVSGVYR